MTDKKDETQGFANQPPKKRPARPGNLRYPSLGTQARNLGKTAKQIVKNPKLADDDLFNKRMEICKACPAYDAKQNRCMKCGCYLKGKARFEAAVCPLRKW